METEHENVCYYGQTNNIGHCGPIWVRNDPKTQEGSFLRSDQIDQKLVRFSVEISQKVELKTWQGRFPEIKMSCLFGRA